MVTIVIDEGTIFALAVSFVIGVVTLLFLYSMELKTELEFAEAQAEAWERLAHDYSDRMIMFKQKYERLRP